MSSATEVITSLPAALGSYIDASWFDIISLIGGCLYAVWHRRRLAVKPPWVSRATAFEVFNGVSLFPLLMLLCGGVSSWALNELVHSNRVIIALAGGLALFAILED